MKVKAELEGHGVFITSSMALARIEREIRSKDLAKRVASYYEGQPIYGVVEYWEHYPDAILQIIIGDCEQDTWRGE